MSFIKRHKLLFVIFIFCILIMIKNSSVPYLFNPPALVAFIFDMPKGELALGISKIIDIFASAYVTSLLFYYMVDYLPSVKQEKKAKEIVEIKLISLYLYISELLAMIEYVAKKDGVYDRENIGKMDNINIQSRTIICKRKSLKNEKENGVIPYTFNLLKDLDKYRNLTRNICNEISGVPSFSYCPSEIIEIISKIQLSELLETIPSCNDILLKLSFNVSYIDFGKSYQNLLFIRDDLKKYVSTRLDCTFVDISKEEYEEWQRKNAEVLRENPEIAKLLAETQQ